ncbi:MAG: toll/interleukin-1 receptor domain-containing protein [Spirochaetales bacterium]|nr:toll/interleukin-1 receptor domain-containing protein [Spirochaetales bacterium]
MQPVVKAIIANLFLIYGAMGGFYFTFHFGEAGRKKKIPPVARFIISIAAVALAVLFFYLIPMLLDAINKNLNTGINKNISVFTLVLLILNACLALYLLLIDIIKKSKTPESPAHRVTNFILCLCLFFYAVVGFFPIIPKGFKGTFHNSHFIILLSGIAAFILYPIWESIKERMGRNKIFISYRRKDSADITGRIVDRLIAKFGSNNILRDVDSIPLGVNFATYIDKLLQSTSVCLVVIGKRWVSLIDNKSEKNNTDSIDFVQTEIETALIHRLPVIPVLLQNATVPTQNQLPKSIEKLSFQNGIAIRPDPDFNLDMERLILGIKDGMRKTKKMRKTYGYKKLMKSRTKVKSTRKPGKKSKSK